MKYGVKGKKIEKGARKEGRGGIGHCILFPAS